MLLQIIRPNGPTLDLEVDERLVVIAGPNGVGKSTLLKELGTEYQQSPRSSDVPHPGAVHDDVRLSSQLVTVEQLSSYNLLLTPDPNRRNTLTQSFGITFEDIQQAFSNEDDVRLSPGARQARTLITPEERAAVAANPPEID